MRRGPKPSFSLKARHPRRTERHRVRERHGRFQPHLARARRDVRSSARREESSGSRMSRFRAGHAGREFVKTALTAGAGALLPAVNAAGQDRRQGRIDVHHHCRTAVQGGAGRGPGSDWSPAKSLEQMDKFGIATSIISATVPAEPFYDGTEKSWTVARGVNDFIAKMMVDHSGRFGLFAAIPMADIDGTLREIEYAFDTLHADGVGIFSSVRDKYPGDPLFAPIWRELNRRKAIVFIHPT